MKIEKQETRQRKMDPESCQIYPNLDLITLSRLIRYQTEFCLVLNRSGNGKNYLNSADYRESEIDSSVCTILFQFFT